eukprot:s435_g5.t1
MQATSAAASRDGVQNDSQWQSLPGVGAMMRGELNLDAAQLLRVIGQGVGGKDTLRRWSASVNLLQVVRLLVSKAEALDRLRANDGFRLAVEDYPSLGKGRAAPAAGVWGPSGPSSTPGSAVPTPPPAPASGGKDMGKGGGKEWGKDWGKDKGGKDWGKDKGGKDWGKDGGKDGGKDKGWGKDGGKDGGKDKGWGKDGGKDGGKDKGWGKDGGKDGGKDKGWSKDGGKDKGWGKDGGKESKGYGQAPAEAPSQPSQAAPSVPPPTAAPSMAPTEENLVMVSAAYGQNGVGNVLRLVKKRRFCILDRGHAKRDTRTLDIPRLTLGTRGEKMRLVSNHFTITVRTDPKSADATVWKCWRVDFARSETVQPKEGGLMKGRAPKAKGEDEREVSKALRKQAVDILLEDVPSSDWLHDGNNLLYTRKTVTSLSDCRKEVEVPPKPGKRAIKVTMEVKFEGREIDLGWLQKPPDHFKDASEAMVAMSEHRRFVQAEVAIRTLALEREELIAQSRKVICPDQRLVCDPVPLALAREMWFGYIAQVEVVNGGILRDGKVGPARTTLSLNLVASVGIPETWFIDLLGKLCSKYPGDKRNEEWYAKDICNNYFQQGNREYQRMRDALRSDLGLRKLKPGSRARQMGQKVRVDYADKTFTGKKVVGITERPANRQEFDCEEMGGRVNVVQYYQHKYGVTVRYPNLPCLELGKPGNCYPLEFVTVLGGEHNLEVGKLKAEFQQEVTRKTAMPPSQRRDQILKAHQNQQLGPAAALEGKGIKVETEMAMVTGRRLEQPRLKDARSAALSVNYSNSFQTVQPPGYEVSWGMWCFSQKLSERDVKWLAGEFVSKTRSKSMRFSEPKMVEWPKESFDAYYEGARRRESMFPKLQEKLRSDLRAAMTDYLYKSTKLITETELGTFVTQFINCKKGVSDAERKLNNIMLKVTPKLPVTLTASRAAHNVILATPHRLLTKEEGTMIMGADVCHKVAGISVAAVVGTTDFSFASYFHEIRGQSPYTLNELKVRSRQSEERIVELSGMTVNILERWRKCHNSLPKTIFYYRDGVSDGQFVNVLTRELNLLEHGFKQVDATYNPQLVIIVGQKRHQTRLWMEQGSEKGGGKGKDDKGKGKGKGKDSAQVPPGTVASDAIAQPSHMNFFLVSQEGIQGTSVPCHYHEQITYQLCHMYSRADKSVGYATPAYMADHACERGRHYLEAHFGASDIQSTMGSSSSEERKEEDMRKQIEERTRWLNNVARKSLSLKLNGLQVLFCNFEDQMMTSYGKIEASRKAWKQGSQVAELAQECCALMLQLAPQNARAAAAAGAGECALTSWQRCVATDVGLRTSLVQGFAEVSLLCMPYLQERPQVLSRLACESLRSLVSCGSAPVILALLKVLTKISQDAKSAPSLFNLGLPELLLAVLGQDNLSWRAQATRRAQRNGRILD